MWRRRFWTGRNFRVRCSGLCGARWAWQLKMGLAWGPRPGRRRHMRRSSGKVHTHFGQRPNVAGTDRRFIFNPWLAVLVTIVSAFLLLPSAEALAAGPATLIVTIEGSGA